MKRHIMWSEHKGKKNISVGTITDYKSKIITILQKIILIICVNNSKKMLSILRNNFLVLLLSAWGFLFAFEEKNIWLESDHLDPPSFSANEYI